MTSERSLETSPRSGGLAALSSTSSGLVPFNFKTVLSVLTYLELVVNQLVDFGSQVIFRGAAEHDMADNPLTVNKE